MNVGWKFTYYKPLIVPFFCRYMFWSDWGVKPMIQRANMDGTDQKILIESDIAWPISLTMDISTYTLYWVDAKPEYSGIYSIKYDGTNRQTVYRGMNIQHPFSLTFYDNRLYWTDWKTLQINSCSKNNGSFQTVREDIQSPMGLAVLSPDRQPSGMFSRYFGGWKNSSSLGIAMKISYFVIDLSYTCFFYHYHQAKPNRIFTIQCTPIAKKPFVFCIEHDV